MVSILRFAVASLAAVVCAGAQCKAPSTPTVVLHDREEPRDSDMSLLQVTVQSAVKTDGSDSASLQPWSPSIHNHAGNTSSTMSHGHGHVGNMTGALGGAHFANTSTPNWGEVIRRKLLKNGMKAHLKIADQSVSSWPARLSGKSVLILGDSLDRNAVRYLCQTHHAPTRPYLEADMASLVGASGYDFCQLGGATIGQFMNYGLFEPPYWMYAYKNMNVNKLFTMPDGLQSTSDQHIVIDASRFKSVTPGGQDPTMVVIQSYLWDLASNWQHEGGMAQGYKPADDFVARWTARLQHQVALVRQVFPTSRLAWRTASPNPEPGTNQDVIHLYATGSHEYPDIIRSMNAAAVAFAGENGLEVLDYASMAEAQGGPTTHGMAYMNLVLNLLEETN